MFVCWYISCNERGLDAGMFAVLGGKYKMDKDTLFLLYTYCDRSIIPFFDCFFLVKTYLFFGFLSSPLLSFGHLTGIEKGE